MKRRSKLLILVAVAAALCCLLVTATSGAEGDNLTWTFDSTTGKLIISGTGEMKSYDYSNLVPWYSYRKSIKTIEIADGVTSIGGSAFQGCSNLTSIGIPSSVTSIEYNAFWYCSSLTSIEIPEGVTSIGSSAFWGCSSLTSIEIPEGVTSIGSSAFYGCSGLTSITVDDSNPFYRSIDGVLFSKDQTTLVCYPAGKTETTYTIPEGVTSIGHDAFSNCSSLTSINIPSGVTSIGYSAFWYCSSLTSVTFGENSQLTIIGDSAFEGCRSLTGVEIPSRVTSIGDLAFRYCRNLTSIEIPSSVTSIGYYAFSNCSSLTSITILSRDVEIYDNSYTIPTTVTIYGYAGSTAQAYAEKYGRAFVALPEEPAPSSSQIILETNQAHAGETVTLTILLQDVLSVKSMMLYDFIYDSAYVEIVEAKWLVDGIIATWDSETGEALMANEANTDLNGGILELVIRVKEGTPDGIQEISFSAILKQEAESGEEVTLDVEVVSGGVEVISYITGDINGDETINSDDAIYLLKHTFLPEQYPLSGSGDMNGDGKVDSDDAVYLLKHTFLPEQYPLP